MIYEARIVCADLSPSTTWLSEDSSGGSSQLKLTKYIPTAMGQENAPVAETLDVLGSFSAIRTAIDGLEQCFGVARDEKNKRVYLEVRVNESDWYRTRVHDGIAQIGPAPFWHNSDYARLQVFVKREFGWEGPEAELALTNASGSGTGGRVVGNENYSTTENWVTVSGAAVLGDLPARTRLELTHTYATNPFIREIWLHHKVDSPASFVHFIQGEAATGGVNTADANASGGSKKSVSWAVTTKTKLLSWTLNAASLDAMAGGQVHAMLRNDGTAYTDLYLQFQLRNPTGSTLISEGALAPVAYDIEMLVLDTMQLPPGGIVSGSSNLLLELYGQRLSAGTHNLAIDFVQLSPVGPGNSWQKLTCIGSGLALNEKLVTDGINERVYRVVAGVNVADWTTEGGGIRLQPGRDQRIYVLGAEVGNSYRRLQTYTARLYYRPRRRSL
ncbi:MAG: hypothetical protein CVU44_21075 [Chloroflexi bacterium HGW-Chloroflexi-6]|nr:MAG: hypothetical protein CVU44_21075 [Chloroflexi bacterium HGW-Chloroflexi-6]